MALRTSPDLPPSLWAATAEPGPPAPRLAGPAEADVAVIGGGFTGLSAAPHLAEAGKQVVLLTGNADGGDLDGQRRLTCCI